jgi:hypothetical protein
MSQQLRAVQTFLVHQNDKAQVGCNIFHHATKKVIRRPARTTPPSLARSDRGPHHAAASVSTARPLLGAGQLGQSGVARGFRALCPLLCPGTILFGAVYPALGHL